MRFAIVNESKNRELTGALLMQISAAVERQLYEHFAPFWDAAGSPVAVKALDKVDANDCLVAIFDTADQAGDLGYHDVSPGGRPYAKAFVQTILDNEGTLTTGSNSLSATLSHELIETSADVYANLWADGPKDLQYALEPGDPVENDSYLIDGVAVSNFVGPRWFGMGPGPYDWMRLLTKPFTMSPNGYMITRSSKGEIKELFGRNYPDWKKPLKAHPASRIQRRKQKGIGI